ncbi:MAG: 30S ribosomal protein S8 [Candidatus Latescibacteria bacterium]|nr:30S ribosomal protein S8 [Candidatus Latescibacterota bacterium]NIM20812.1 30S ribosomal protein S8 [Candidatus Latescibacterota bacterium]NIM64378.1 30S ribosomal protein S8 [Candidatus Latescibacterota bacterium]NIO00529.1 30S ribosomal protein S8 [Candidatus Latescibacterota bacterium]NIO26932.1 30S ribosomal protein S8 [Candidatus Latescibacterota bacterium]
MTMTDPISDYLTRIRNAARARHKHVDVPASRVKAELSKILVDAGFLKDVKYIEDNRQGILRLYLKYDKEMQCAINGLRRVSKPSLRIYSPRKKIPRVLGGYGMAILSTSQGILSDKECLKRRIGGEVICEVW